ncbi:MAG: hypothetical protein ACOVNU_04175 [Candidatus Kapaibacteriota bacterium]
MNNNKKSSVTQLIEEIQRRVSIIQSEPQTMARELMIDNLAIDLEQYEVMHKEEIIEAASDHCYPTYELAKIDAEDYYNKTFKSE